jgi:5-methylcytosine-specific restriction endonuclease McrA
VSRKVEEWVGASDDSKIPARVKQRVAARSNLCCKNCGVRVTFGGEIDHVIALANWIWSPEVPHGNRETNLRLLCRSCHATKSRDDVSEKSKIAQIKKRMGPLRREQSEWSKRYHAMKKWIKRREQEKAGEDV